MTIRRLIGLLVALVLVGGHAAATPAGASAAPAKAKKCKKRASAKQKCKRAKKRTAAKPVAGPPGQPGAQGPAGPAGPPGTTIVARARLAAPMTITGEEMVDVPLTGASWTQQADETDDFVGEVTVTTPAACDVSGPGPTDDPIFWAESELYGYEFFGGGWGALKLGEDYIGYVDFHVWEEEAGKTVTQSFYIDRKLMEPGTPTARQLTFEFGKYCEGEGQDFRVEAVKVTVVGIR